MIKSNQPNKLLAAINQFTLENKRMPTNDEMNLMIDKLKVKRKPRVIPETITEKELLDVVKHTKAAHHKLAYMLGFYEGLRISEVVNLKLDNVDRERRLLFIKQGKGKKDRTIPIAPEVMKGLKHLPIPCGVRALQIAFKLKAKKVLNKDLHFHTLRHSGATHYLNIKKWDIRHVQVFLGHSRINITEIYTHVNPVDLVNKMWE